MHVTAELGSLSAIMKDVEGELAGKATAAMRTATQATKDELREQVSGAGLGTRLAKTWQANVYPNSSSSLNPAGYIYSKAPDIVDAFVRGATIVPVNGGRYLAIPTNNVPRRPGRGTRRMTPVEVEATFNQDLFFLRGKQGRLLAFIKGVDAKSGRGARRATSGRVKQGRTVRPILMFTMVPAVHAPKLLDLAGPAERWADRFATE